MKKTLRRASDHPNHDWRKILEQTKGILFLSTPHLGSDLAKWAEFAKWVLRLTDPARELAKSSADFRELNAWYRDNSSDIHTEVFYEELDTPIGPLKVCVVSRDSVDPGITGVVPIPFDADHISIAKPSSENAQLYCAMQKFVRTCLSKARTDSLLARRLRRPAISRST